MKLEGKRLTHLNDPVFGDRFSEGSDVGLALAMTELAGFGSASLDNFIPKARLLPIFLRLNCSTDAIRIRKSFQKLFPSQLKLFVPLELTRVRTSVESKLEDFIYQCPIRMII